MDAGDLHRELGGRLGRDHAQQEIALRLVIELGPTVLDEESIMSIPLLHDSKQISNFPRPAGPIDLVLVVCPPIGSAREDRLRDPPVSFRAVVPRHIPEDKKHQADFFTKRDNSAHSCDETSNGS